MKIIKMSVNFLLFDQLKDEQNIKRRVYDALNVLIASKVIEKRGKTVKSCNSSHLNGK